MSYPNTQQAPYGASGNFAPRKSYLTTWLLSILAGSFGVDRFYIGKIGTGVAKLLTLGGLGFWVYIDLFLLVYGKQTDAQGRQLEGYQTHRQLTMIITWVMFATGIVVGVMYALFIFALIVAGVSAS